MKTHTDTQLKQTLVKMLPETVCMGDIELVFLYPSPYRHDGLSYRVLDTELLHLCWLVEETLNEELEADADYFKYCNPHATWQQRTTALAKVKGIEVV